MNRSEAYQICHEIMLTNPNYVACENARLTYMLVQISDRPKEIGIHTFLINPGIPDEGNTKLFVDMTDDQQIGILSLCPVSETIRKTHQKIKELKRLSQNVETRDECVEILRRMFSQLTDTN